MELDLLKEMIDCGKREVSFRYKVYPRFISAGKMTKEQAEYQQAMMYKVQKYLEAVYKGASPENIQLRLL